MPISKPGDVPAAGKRPNTPENSPITVDRYESRSVFIGARNGEWIELDNSAIRGANGGV